MEKTKFSPQQEKAITAHGKDILVSAAAGSGKTAVLVERVIRMILEKGMSIDRILIVTFTKAATAEMAQRISDAIYSELEKNPEREDLKNQISLLNKASITTMDSFFNSLVSKYFKFAGADPNYKIAGNNELALKRREILEKIFEKHFAQKDKNFIDFVNRFGDDNFNNNRTAKIVLDLYDELQKIFDSNGWIKKTRQLYAVSNAQELQKTQIWKFREEKRNELFESIIKCADFLCEISANFPIYKEEEKKKKSKILKEDSTYAFAKAILNMTKEEIAAFEGKFPRSSPIESIKRWGEKYNFDSSRFLIYFYALKYYISEIKKYTDDEILEEISENSAVVNTMLDIVEEFSDEYWNIKKENSVYTFSDITKMCVRILIDENGSPTEQAREINEQYDAIIIDEYQDSDNIQDKIFETISNPSEKNNYKHKINRFMVGDIKQCIYGFRNANPEVFINKYEKYSLAGENGTYRIDLSENYRSRKTVLDSINNIFEVIMNKSTGNIDYDENAALRFPKDSVYDGEDVKSEFYALEKNKNNAEAELIAERIQEIICKEKPLIYDKSIRAKRPAEYRDIVILMRSTKKIEKIYTKALSGRGIPVFCNRTSGYFDKTEISTIINVLKLVDNPKRDIELISVLHSPLYGVTADELMEIRNPDFSFNRAFSSYAENEENKNTPLYKKIMCFKEDLERWKHLADIMPVSNVIYKIYMESGYISFINMLKDCDTMKANIQKLIDMAVDFEKFNNSGLFGFIRYIDNIITSEKDIGEASSISESDNVVKIINVHKSKGLEYPIVFVSGLGYNFNMQDISGEVLTDTKLGIAINRTYLKHNKDYGIKVCLKASGAIKSLFAMKMKMKLFSEEMRIFYVALTRARERLILTGEFDKISDMEARIKSFVLNPHYTASPFSGDSTKFKFSKRWLD